MDPLYARPRDDGKIHCNPVTRAILERTNPPFSEVTHSKCHCPPKCGLLERTMCCHHVLVNGRNWRRGCCCRVDERHITTSNMRTLRALWGWHKCFGFERPQRSHGRYGMAVWYVWYLATRYGTISYVTVDNVGVHRFLLGRHTHSGRCIPTVYIKRL